MQNTDASFDCAVLRRFGVDGALLDNYLDPGSGGLLTSQPAGVLRHMRENAECANRGTCNRDTGLCECFEGFAGHSCSTVEKYAYF